MFRRMPSLNAARAFEMAARHLSFSHAADELCVIQGAVSRQVKALEKYLGATLFHRLTRALELTEADREYHVTNHSDRQILTVGVLPTFACTGSFPASVRSSKPTRRSRCASSPRSFCQIRPREHRRRHPRRFCRARQFRWDVAAHRPQDGGRLVGRACRPHRAGRAGARVQAGAPRRLPALERNGAFERAHSAPHIDPSPCLAGLARSRRHGQPRT